MQTDAESLLLEAGRNLYHTFRNYRGQPTWGNEMAERITDEDFCVVRQRVQDLERHHFGYYGWKSVSLHEAGTPALKYFFPRVLHEAAFPAPNETSDWETGSPPLEMYLYEMRKHDWQGWPENERAAIIGFFKAWFHACLAHPVWRSANASSPYRANRYAGDILRLAAFLGIDSGPWLAEWARDESPASTSQLIGVLWDHEAYIATHATLHRWARVWAGNGVSLEAIQHFVRFLTSSRTYSRLERAFFEATHSDVQKELAKGVDQLRNIYEIWHGTLAGTGKIPRWAEEIAAQMCAERKK